MTRSVPLVTPQKHWNTASWSNASHPPLRRPMVAPRPYPSDAIMSASKHRYRITVTPIETDGQQCSGRCTIEFEQRSQYNWMRQLESAQGQRRLSCNEDAGVVVATGLLETLAESADKPDSLLGGLQPELGQLLRKLQALQASR